MVLEDLVVKPNEDNHSISEKSTCLVEEIIQKLTAKNPECRISPAQALELPFFIKVLHFMKEKNRL